MESSSSYNHGKNHISLKNEIVKEDKPDIKGVDTISKGNNEYSHVTNPDNKVSQNDTKKNEFIVILKQILTYSFQRL